jgi:Kef-type K+ transport system membrane component KefB
MLFSLNKMHLKSSKATLGAAIIDDILAVILLSVFFICVQTGVFGVVEGFVSPVHTASIVEAFVYMLISFAIIFCAGYFIIPPIIMWLQQKKFAHLIAPVANGVMLLYFAFAELVGGLAGITGAYFAGLFHRMGDKRHYAERAISPFVHAFLLPLFLGSIGLQVDISILTRGQWLFALLLLVVAILSKVIGCYIATSLSNISGRRKSNRWTWLESYLFGSSMVARGEVGLVVATILSSAKIISPDQYIIVVVVIVLSTIASPVMLSLGFSFEQAKKIEATIEHYVLNINRYPSIGTARMYSIIIACIEATKSFNTAIRISEGRRVVNLQGYDVKIILDPEKGIIFEGNRGNIAKILQMVKTEIADDLERFKQVEAE